MTSSIGSVSSQPQTQVQTQTVRSAPPQQAKGGQDSDGDKDGSKVGEVESSGTNKGPISATVGNNINTTA